jgi:hypothetical protein
MGSAVGIARETGELEATSGVVCVSRGAVVGGAASAFFEKDHMPRVARGVCTPGGHQETCHLLFGLVRTRTNSYEFVRVEKSTSRKGT